MIKRQFTISMTILLSAMLMTGFAGKEETTSQKLTEWRIAPSTAAVTPGLMALAVTDADEQVADADYPTSGWIMATVPGTVLGNLVDNGIYDDLFEPDNDGVKNVFFHDNLSKIPAEDFDHQWWYSTEFTLPARAA